MISGEEVKVWEPATYPCQKPSTLIWDLGIKQIWLYIIYYSAFNDSTSDKFIDESWIPKPGPWMNDCSQTSVSLNQSQRNNLKKHHHHSSSKIWWPMGVGIHTENQQGDPSSQAPFFYGWAWLCQRDEGKMPRLNCAVVQVKLKVEGRVMSSWIIS